ncbi:MAG: hypothetical protein K2K89_07845 [Ruminococcus sp.]|nr:hypothetical protein [Ruminococcus sp.]
MQNTLSEKIYVSIDILNEIQKLNIKNPSVVTSNSRSENFFMVQQLFFDSITIVASNINTPIRHIEDIMADINVTDTRGFQLTYFWYNIIDWLVTDNKSVLKNVLMKNIESDYDVEYINNWYE